MYKLFQCFKRKLSEEEYEEIRLKRLRLLPLYHQVIKKHEKININ